MEESEDDMKCCGGSKEDLDFKKSAGFNMKHRVRQEKQIHKLFRKKSPQI